ncbi:MAG: hypothetical protein QW487_02230 [Candidatus Bathyarchaeia archaeon]|nr:hypothetical protein [Candidatus Bathyarchaeota archaeon]
MNSSTDIYDLAIAAGSALSYTVDKTTVSNMISVFQGNPKTEEAFKQLILYIARQIGRNEIRRDVGKVILSHLKRIYEEHKNNEDELQRNINTYLIFTKWAYESKIRAQSFNEFLSKITTEK